MDRGAVMRARRRVRRRRRLRAGAVVAGASVAVAAVVLLVPRYLSSGSNSGRATSHIAASPAIAGASATTSPVASADADSSALPGAEPAAWVLEENELPGTTSWQIGPTSSGTIAGFADVASATVGEQVNLYVTTDAATFTVQAYRMGYYGGDGARLVWTSPAVTGVDQPACSRQTETNMVSCDNWAVSLTFPVTAAFVQGDYLLKLVGSGGQASYVPLTVWDPTSHATYVVENDIYTWQAWNTYGGYDFYQGDAGCGGGYPPCDRALVVSFDRPYAYGEGAADFLGEELPLVRFVEQHGLDVTYATSDDVASDPSFLGQHKVFMSLGHDECWSLPERQAAVAAEQNGVNMIFFGASAILRHVRLEASPLGPDRQEVDYRDSAEDPLDGTGDPLEVTGNTWSAAPASWSEVPFVGGEYTGYLEPGEKNVAMVVADASSWLFAGTGLQNGSEVPGLLDSDFDQYQSGESPANIEILAHSPMPRYETQSSVRYPSSDITYYSDPSSHAGVFDTGTVAWIPDITTSSVIDQMTANLLALFGTGPTGGSQPSQANWSQFY